MKNNRMKTFLKENWFKLIISLVILSVGIVVVCHYVFYIPKNNECFQWQKMEPVKQKLQDEEYNSLKQEFDYYKCLDTARMGYELLWKEHCKDMQLSGYCNLPALLQENMRNAYYEPAKNKCYKEYNPD